MIRERTGIDSVSVELLKELSQVKKMLQKREEQWVKVSVIVQLTGWDKEALRRARNRGEIKYKKNKTGIWYDANSLLPIYKKSA